MAEIMTRCRKEKDVLTNGTSHRHDSCDFHQFSNLFCGIPKRFLGQFCVPYTSQFKRKYKNNVFAAVLICLDFKWLFFIINNVKEMSATLHLQNARWAIHNEKHSESFNAQANLYVVNNLVIGTSSLVVFGYTGLMSCWEKEYVIHLSDKISKLLRINTNEWVFAIKRAC